MTHTRSTPLKRKMLFFWFGCSVHFQSTNYVNLFRSIIFRFVPSIWCNSWNQFQRHPSTDHEHIITFPGFTIKAELAECCLFVVECKQIALTQINSRLTRSHYHRGTSHRAKTNVLKRRRARAHKWFKESEREKNIDNSDRATKHLC